MSLNIDKSCTGEELEAELGERGKFYAKSFGAVLGMKVVAGLDIFLDDPVNNYSYADHTREGVEDMVRYYERISFGEMIDHPDVDVLFEIREAVFGLRNEIGKILSGDFSRGDIAFGCIETISDLGQVYRKRLQLIQDVLRTKPGFEQAGLRAVDIVDGAVWLNALG